MKVIAQIDRLEGRGLLGGKTKYKFTGRLVLNPQELEVTSQCSVNSGNVFDHYEADDEFRSKHTEAGRVENYYKGMSFEFDHLAQAVNLRGGLVDAAERFKSQIEFMGSEIRRLGSPQEIEIGGAQSER